MKFKVLITIFISILLLGCPNPTQRIVSEEKVLIQISSDINNSRTILPDAPTISNYSIMFTGSKIIPSIVTSKANEEITLPDGTWNITVNAYDSNNKLVAAGSSSVTVPDERSVTIDLSPNISLLGKGSLDFGIEYSLPQGVDVTGCEAKLISLSDKSEILLDVDLSSTPVKVSKSDIQSGSYIFTVKFSSSSNLTPYSDVVQIYDNINTQALISLSIEHFNNVPFPPSNLSLNDTVEGVVLKWECNAFNETGYIVERKEGDGNFAVLADINKFNVQSYLDKTVVDGTSYLYRVAAKNSVGQSLYSGSEEIAVSTEPDIIYVAMGGIGSGNKWDNPMGSIQGAIDKAATYNRKPQVWVKAGTYKPESTPNPVSPATTRDYHFSLKNGVSIFGGFVGNETTLDQRDYANNLTILSGDFNNDDTVSYSSNRPVFTNNAENSYSVFYHPVSLNLTGDEVIDGFVIKGGNSNKDDNDKGGAIENYTNLKVANCQFIGNFAKGGGGAIFNSVGKLEITNSVFELNGNRESYGGAIQDYEGSINITNSVFYQNSTEYPGLSSSASCGGAVALYSSKDAEILNSLFIKNRSGHGGAIYTGNAKFKIINSIFLNNSIDSSFKCSTFHFRDDSGNSNNSLVSRCIDDVSDNSCTKNEVVIKDAFTTVPDFVNSLSPKGEDNLWMTEDDGYILKGGSFGLSASDNEYTQAKDILGNERGDKPDLGPYESSFSDDQNPGVVGNILTTPLNGAVKFTFTNPIDPDFKNVVIEWASRFGHEGILVVPDKNEEVIIPALTNNQEYTFDIYSMDYAGNSSARSEVKETPALLGVKDVENVKALAFNKRVYLSWDDPKDTDFEWLEIYVHGDDGIDFTKEVEKGEEEGIFDNLQNGVNYTFTIKVKDYAYNYSNGITTSITPQEIIYVDIDATGKGDGTSWTNAVSDLSQAINNASRYTEIWVAEGTYIPSYNPLNPESDDIKSFHFYIPPYVNVYGGFKGNETELEQRDYINNRTILSGDINGDDIISGYGKTLEIKNNEENVNNVIYIRSETSSYTRRLLNGVTITGGNAVKDSNKNGGGIYIYNTAINLENCIFIGNNALTYGGGAYLGYAYYGYKSTLENVAFINNTAYNAGGLSINHDSFIKGSLFIGNNSKYGAALYSGYETNILYGTFYGNYSEYSGAVFYYKNGSNNINITNSILSNNKVGSGDTIIYTGDRAKVHITNSAVSDFNPDLDILGTLTCNYLLNENINLKNIDNLPGNDGVWLTEDDGLNLAEGSKAVDFGETYVEFILRDITGGKREQGKRQDIGAYESPYSDEIPPSEVSYLVENRIAPGETTLKWNDPDDYDYWGVVVSWINPDGSTETRNVEKEKEELVITGLDSNPDHTYTFTVKTVDLTGNQSRGLEINKNLSGLNIYLTAPKDETITFNKEDGYEITVGQNLNIYVSDYFDDYSWYLNGVTLDNSIGNITIEASSMKLGLNRIMCVVKKDGAIYSKNLVFQVSNN